MTSNGRKEKLLECGLVSSSGECCPKAEIVAREAVRKTFEALGVDITDPAQLLEFQKSLKDREKLRRVFGRISKTVAGIFSAGIIFLLFH